MFTRSKMVLLACAKTERRTDSNPVCVLTVEVATVDQIYVEFVDRTPAQSQLETRFSRSDGILARAEQTENFGSERPNIVRRAPVDAGAISRIVLLGNAIP